MQTWLIPSLDIKKLSQAGFSIKQAKMKLPGRIIILGALSVEKRSICKARSDFYRHPTYDVHWNKENVEKLTKVLLR